jgi:lipid II:glycine glycyltransferase (peptidoglycan interpeptide bridge formation enzyme)
MVVIKKNFFWFTVNEKWFRYKFGIKDLLALTACMHVKNQHQGMLSVKRSSYTVENDLTPTEAEILASFKKTVQVEIKQAQRMNLQCRFKNDIPAFAAFYNQFAVHRKIDAVTEKRLVEMKDNLRMSFVMQDENILAAHSYICDSECKVVRLMHAASLRLDAGADKQLAGRANKLLHYFDMCEFKNEGIRVYDFGGYDKNSTDKGMQGINSFKLSFGGTITECHNYFSYPYVIIKKLFY